MRARALLTAGATALLLGALPVAATAQDTTNDPNDLDGTFVPSAPDGASQSDAGADPASDVDTTTDSLPNTGGGMALAGGAAVAGAALLRGRRH